MVEGWKRPSGIVISVMIKRVHEAIYTCNLSSLPFPVHRIAPLLCSHTSLMPESQSHRSLPTLLNDGIPMSKQTPF